MEVGATSLLTSVQELTSRMQSSAASAKLALLGDGRSAVRELEAVVRLISGKNAVDADINDGEQSCAYIYRCAPLCAQEASDRAASTGLRIISIETHGYVWPRRTVPAQKKWAPSSTKTYGNLDIRKHSCYPRCLDEKFQPRSMG
jgi:hypothetical protein